MTPHIVAFPPRNFASKTQGNSGVKRNRLLFVDDEPNIRLTLPMILKQEGFEVTTAATVPEALDHIVKQTFDVLLADLNIGQPGDGFTIVSPMRRTQPEALTLILTGYPDFDTALQALRDQVDDYLTKPADIKYLVSSVKEKLKQPLRKRPLQTKRVSTIIRESTKQIVQEWFEAVSSDPSMSRLPLSKKERINHFPEFLEELADRIGAERSEGLYETREAARTLGKLRREQGYGVAQIIAEAGILHNVISKNLQEKLLSIDMSTLISDLMEIGERLNEQLEESVRAYVGGIKVLSIVLNPSAVKTRHLLMKQAGFEVTTVSGIDEGKRTAEKSSFDLFVIGHAAPYEERLQFLRWLRSRFGDETRIVVLTGPHEGDFAEADGTAEASNPQEVLNTIQNCVPLSPSIRRRTARRA